MALERYAQVIDGVVANVVESEHQPDHPVGKWMKCGLACPGWSVDEGGNFVSPPMDISPPKFSNSTEFP